jgi:SAM-dependent methyltransferase
MMKHATRIMEITQAYRLWQAPFAEKKFAPILAHNDLRQARRVLDVGCGPGTNTSRFSHTYYLGIDHNLRYLQHARGRHGRDFLVADITRLVLGPKARFDFILINSFLHHVDTPSARGLLSQLSALLTEDGHVHILDLVLPAQLSVARLLARLDRGEFPRPLGDWERIFNDPFETEIFEPYPLTGGGATLWEMVYFKGRRKR